MSYKKLELEKLLYLIKIAREIKAPNVSFTDDTIDFYDLELELEKSIGYLKEEKARFEEITKKGLGGK